IMSGRGRGMSIMISDVRSPAPTTIIGQGDGRIIRPRGKTQDHQPGTRTVIMAISPARTSRTGEADGRIPLRVPAQHRVTRRVLARGGARDGLECEAQSGRAGARSTVWTAMPARALEDSNPPLYRWFPDGELNTAFNALDRHADGGR